MPCSRCLFSVLDPPDPLEPAAGAWTVALVPSLSVGDWAAAESSPSGSAPARIKLSNAGAVGRSRAPTARPSDVIHVPINRSRTRIAAISPRPAKPRPARCYSATPVYDHRTWLPGARRGHGIALFKPLVRAVQRLQGNRCRSNQWARPSRARGTAYGVQTSGDCERGSPKQTKGLDEYGECEG